MEIEEKKIGSVLVVVPRDSRIDAAVSTEFKGRMVDWINEGSKLIVLDLSHVDFVDSRASGYWSPHSKPSVVRAIWPCAVYRKQS